MQQNKRDKRGIIINKSELYKWDERINRFLMVDMIRGVWEMQSEKKQYVVFQAPSAVQN